jgi:histidine triad (HIT) family protein
MIGMEECIFCTIGKNKDEMIYEDEVCYAVPDKYPSNYGHMLVISKEHYENVLVTPNEIVSRMFIVAKDIGKKLKEKLNADGLNIGTNTGREAGQIIFHFHIHMVPKYETKRIGFMPHREITPKEAAELKKLVKS